MEHVDETIDNVIDTKECLAKPLAPTCSLDGQAGPMSDRPLCGGLLSGSLKSEGFPACGFPWVRIPVRGSPDGAPHTECPGSGFPGRWCYPDTGFPGWGSPGTSSLYVVPCTEVSPALAFPCNNKLKSLPRPTAC